MSDELVQEWIRKAEEDYAALIRLRDADVGELPDVIAFHAQQCAEKYLKALLQHCGIEPPRIHHLPALLDLLAAAGRSLESLREPCENLAPYAVHFRYPGFEASAQDAAEATELSKQVRMAIREELGYSAA